jgi:hypothetical protein
MIFGAAHFFHPSMFRLLSTLKLHEFSGSFCFAGFMMDSATGSSTDLGGNPLAECSV